MNKVKIVLMYLTFALKLYFVAFPLTIPIIVIGFLIFPTMTVVNIFLPLVLYMIGGYALVRFLTPGRKRYG